MNSTLNSTTPISNRSSNSLPSGQVACINCNAFFNPDVLPHCPSCGLHYQEMICMHCSESFDIPSSSQQEDRRYVNCSHCGQSNYCSFLPGVTDYIIVTDFPLDMDYSVNERTEYPAPPEVTDYPFEEESLESYPRLIQYNPALPLGPVRALPFPSREYSLNLDSMVHLEYNKRMRMRGFSLRCNTTNTPVGAKLCARIRDRQQCLQLEAECIPAKGDEEFCLFDFGFDYIRFSREVCLSFWWEMNGSPLNQDVMVWSTTDPVMPVWEDRQGVSFKPALIVFSYVFDIRTRENSYCYTPYPVFYATTGYPTTGYPTSEYPTSEYPTSEYVTSEYPATEYQTSEYPSRYISVPDSISFTLMEEEKNLWHQPGTPGTISDSFNDSFGYTFFPDEALYEKWILVDSMDMAIPREQFGNIPGIEVEVVLGENQSPLRVYATWDTEQILRIDLAGSGIRLLDRLVPVSWGMISIPSVHAFHVFCNRNSGNPIGAIFGSFRANGLTTYEESDEYNGDTAGANSMLQASGISALPSDNGNRIRSALAEEMSEYVTEYITEYPTTDYPTTEYPTDFPTDYPTDYVTEYPADENGTSSPAMGDSAPWNQMTCYCFKEDGSCDDEDLKNGNGGNGNNNGGGGNGGGGGGGGTGGNGSGGSNLSSGMGMNYKASPGVEQKFATYPASIYSKTGNVSTGDKQALAYKLASPASINYQHVTQRRVAGINYYSAEKSINEPNVYCIVTENGHPRYSGPNNEYIVVAPIDRSQTKPEQLETITITEPDGSGLPAQTSWLQETLADGTLLRYSSVTGEVAAIKPPKLNWSTPQDWEQNVRVIYEDPDNPEGDAPAPTINDNIENTLFKRPGNIRQIWSKKDGLMDVTTQSATKYTMTWYAARDVGAYNEQTRRYAVTAGAVPVKQWIMESEFIDYTTRADGKKYETGTNRLLSENDLKLLRSYTVTEIRGAESFVSHWEQPDANTLIFTRGEGSDAETIVTTRTATDPDTLENLKAEYQFIDNAYLRVGDTFTREVEETRTVPGVPGGTRVRYRRYPFGDVCTLWEQGVGTDLSRTVTYEYDLDTDSPSYGCRLREIYSSGKIIEMAYDTKKRLIMKKEPWAGGTSKITRYTYCAQTQYLHRLASETETLLVTGNWASAGRDWEKVISRKQYAYSETPALKEEKVTWTAFAWKDIDKSVPADPRVSITQWYGEDTQANGSDSAHAAGRLKRKQDFSGRETQYRYHDSTEPGIAYTCTITQTVDGQGEPGQSTQTVYYYDENERTVRREEYCHTGQGLIMVNSERYTRDDMNRVIRTDKANGKHVSTLWTCSGPAQETDEDGVSTYYQYDSARRLVSVTQESPLISDRAVAAGVTASPLPCRTTAYIYDAAGRIIQENTTTGQTATSRETEWDALDRVVTETDETGRITGYAYSADGLQTTVTQPAGATLVTLYHKDGSVLMEGGTGRQSRHYTYRLWSDSLFTRVTLQSTDGPIAQDTFTNGYGQVILTMTPRGTGKVVRHTLYDDKGSRTFTRTSHQPGGTRMEYDAFGQMVRQTLEQPDPHVNRISETSHIYLLQTIAPAFLTTNAPEWTSVPLVWRETVQNSRLEGITDSSRITKSWELVSETLPNVRRAVLTQTPQGVMTAEWTEDNQGNLFQYKAIQGSPLRSYTIAAGGRTLKQKDLTGTSHTWNYQYLASGLKQSVTDGRDNTRTTQYNLAGQILTQTDTAGSSTHYAYDAATGQLLTVTNPDGKTTSYDYDQRGRTVAVYGTAVQPVRVEYDDADRITALYTWRTPGSTLRASPLSRTDGDITRWTYNAASGAVTKKKMADGSTIDYYYDSTGMLTGKTQASGVGITYTYDPVTEQPVSMEYSDGTPGLSYTRDKWEQIETITDASGTRTLTYDVNGSLIEENHSGSSTQTLTYATNEWGMQNGYSLSLEGTIRQELHCAYGDDLRIHSLRTRDGGEYAYTWKDNCPLLENLALPNGITREYSYDFQRDFLTEIRYRSQADNTLHTHEYSYDLLGRLTSRDSGSARHHEYAYNDRGEVTGHTLTDAAHATDSDQWTYSYDNIGNRLQAFKNTDGRDYTANELNQYTQITPSGTAGTTSGETITPAFDLDGNQTRVNTETGNWTVTWNAENRPIAFVSGDKRIECIYDHMGRRVQKTVLIKGTPDSCLRYVYKGYQLVAELDALDKNDHPQPLKSWIWDPTRAEDATPLEISLWQDESEDTQYPETEYPTTDYPTTEYQTTEYPDSEYPDTVFPKGHFFTSADLYWNEPREELVIHYLDNGEITLDMQGFIPSGTTVCLDRVELAVKGEYPGWAQYNDKYKVEISLDRQSSMTVYAELDGDTLKIDLTAYYGKDQRTLTSLGNIQMKFMASPRGTAWENWSPIHVLPCYHDSTGKPLAHVSGVYLTPQNTSEFATTGYPTTAYPTTEYPTTEYPTTDYPTTDYPTTDYPTTEYPTAPGPFFQPTDNDLYLRDGEVGDYLADSYYDTKLNLPDSLSTPDSPRMIIDLWELACETNEPLCSGTLFCQVLLDDSFTYIPCRMEGAKLIIDFISSSIPDSSRTQHDLYDMHLYTLNEQTGAYGEGPMIAFWRNGQDHTLLMHVMGRIEGNGSSSESPSSSSESSSSCEPSLPNNNHTNTRAALAARANQNTTSFLKQTPDLQIGNITPSILNTLSTMNNNTLPNNSPSYNQPSTMPSPIFRYDDEFGITNYDEDNDFPSYSPTFYEDSSDTVWIRPNAIECSYERDYAIRFNLDEELPKDKDLVIDGLTIIIYATGNHTNLTVDLYLDNTLLTSIPYRHYSTNYFDLKNLNISEQDRTLTSSKNIMVRFTQSGHPYLKMGIGCASPGLPAGHIQGRLKNRNRLLPKSTYHCLTDHNKNITGLTDSQGNISATWDYDAFGNIIHQTGSTTNRNPLRFSSEYHDEDLGLIYYNYRHYNPKDGRWISLDPLGEEQQSNLYAFVRNPVQSLDSLGLYIFLMCREDPQKQAEKLSKEFCKTKRKKKKEILDNLISNSNPNKPDCSDNSSCQKITLVIEVSDPCDGIFAYGHSGMAIDDWYNDLGAKPDSLFVDKFWANHCNNSLQRLSNEYINDHFSIATAPTLKVEFCVCRSEAKKMKEKWAEITASFDDTIPPIWGFNTTCSSSIFEVLSNGCNDSFITPDQILLEIAPYLKNRCGSQFGKSAHIEYMHDGY